jgi:hypothetical protein
MMARGSEAGPGECSVPAVDQQVVERPAAGWNGKTNGFSIAALVMALFGCALPVSTAFGIAGLIQSRRNGDRRGRVFAVIALVVNSLVVLAIAIAVGISLADGPDRDASGVVRGERSIALGELREGDCVREISVMLGAYVDVVPCAEPHESEVFGVYELPAGQWPGDDAVKKTADAGCADRYLAYAGKDADLVATLTLPPDESEWSGRRQVTCMTYLSSPATGTIRTTR